MMDDIKRPDRSAPDIKARGANLPVSRTDQPKEVAVKPAIEPLLEAEPMSEPAPEPKNEPNSDPKPEPKQEPEAPKPPEKARAPVFAIAVAVLVSGALIGLTIFAFNRTQKQENSKTDSTTQEQVSDEDVQSTSDDIEEALNELDDEADFNESDVSDTTLEL